MQCVIQNIYGTFLYMVHWGIFYIQTQQNIENWIEYRKQYAHGFTIRLLCYFFCYWKKNCKEIYWIIWFTDKGLWLSTAELSSY